MATRRLTWAGVTKIVTSFRSWRRSPNSRSSRSPARSNRVSRATAWFTAFSSGLDGVRPYSRRPSDASVETVSGSAGGWRSNCSRTRSGTSYPHTYTGASSSSATVALGAASALAAAEAWVSSNSPAAWVTGRSSRGSGTEQSRSTSSPVASDASTGSGSRVVRCRCTRSRSCASRRSLNVETPSRVPAPHRPQYLTVALVSTGLIRLGTDPAEAWQIIAESLSRFPGFPDVMPCSRDGRRPRCRHDRRDRSRLLQGGS